MIFADSEHSVGGWTSKRHDLGKASASRVGLIPDESHRKQCVGEPHARLRFNARGESLSTSRSAATGSASSQ